MIIWLSSYPKSGNTLVRSLLSAYLFTDDGNFNFPALKNISLFPDITFFEKLGVDVSKDDEVLKNYIRAQEEINRKNKKAITFLKTHSTLHEINNHKFTNYQNTSGVIYIVRDPRNVITSLKNHYELSYDEAFEFIINERKYIFDYHKKDDYSDFQFIGSWKTNFQSWKYQNEFPIKFIKYEDLLEQTYSVALDLVEFINKVQKNSNKIDKIKLQNAIDSTAFDNLKKNELKYGFAESIFSKRENKKIPFFNLGPSNQWSKILDKNIQDKILDSLADNLKELSYL